MNCIVPTALRPVSQQSIPISHHLCICDFDMSLVQGSIVGAACTWTSWLAGSSSWCFRCAIAPQIKHITQRLCTINISPGSARVCSLADCGFQLKLRKNTSRLFQFWPLLHLTMDQPQVQANNIQRGCWVMMIYGFVASRCTHHSWKTPPQS